MKVLHYLHKLESSREYKKFIEDNKDSYLCAGFFVLDYENEKDIHQVDYYVPSKKKIAALILDGGVKVQLSKETQKKKPEKLEGNAKIDLDAIKGMIEDEMKNHMLTDKILKIIAVLHNSEGKRIWNINCILNGMGLLRIHIDDETGNILKFEKVSMMDFIKKI
ncbi:hypothetical protein HYV49_06390 [Candidatus Pacearchaeota archaeon]|nr:hypothetical protein [Candidatus Pacearchaeota archaeon]